VLGSSRRLPHSLPSVAQVVDELCQQRGELLRCLHMQCMAGTGDYLNFAAPQRGHDRIRTGTRPQRRHQGAIVSPPGAVRTGRMSTLTARCGISAVNTWL
jgi:hypothetical protein